MQCRICGDTRECSSLATNPFACQCDDECAIFDDCYTDASDSLDDECVKTFTEEDYRCRSLVTNATKTQLAVYTISKCPSGWIEEEEVDTEIRQIISDNCNSMDSFPPVTDFETGLVFNNEFCALCHDVQSPILWSTLYFCSTAVDSALSSGTLTTQVLTEFCEVSHFYPPQYHFQLQLRRLSRFCSPSISTCPPADQLNTVTYDEIINECKEGYQNLVTISSMSESQLIFRNEYCALCNGYLVEDLECFNNVTHMFTRRSNSQTQVTLLVDAVSKVGQLSSTKTTILDLVDGCELGCVFNSITNNCQGTVCNFVVNEEPTASNGCSNFSPVHVSTTDAEYTDAEYTDAEYTDAEYTDNNRSVRFEPEGSAGSGIEEEEGRTEFTCQSVMVIEDASQYVTINRTLIFYRPP